MSVGYAVIRTTADMRCCVRYNHTAMPGGETNLDLLYMSSRGAPNITLQQHKQKRDCAPEQYKRATDPLCPQRKARTGCRNIQIPRGLAARRRGPRARRDLSIWACGDIQMLPPSEESAQSLFDGASQPDLPHVTLPDTIASGITTVLSSPAAAAAKDCSEPLAVLVSVDSTIDLSGRGGSVSDGADPLDVESTLVDVEDEDGAVEALVVEEGVEAEAEAEEGDEEADSLAVATAVSSGVACSEAGELGLDVFDAVGEGAGAASSDSSGVSASAGAMACTDDAGDAFTSGVEDG